MTDSRGSILVVDDEAGIRRALRGTLAALGFAADEAASGERSIELAGRHRYDAILLDINLPGMGGIETCRQLRHDWPGTGILMLTVRDSETDKVEALDAGADDYITKPFAIRELIARVQAVRRGRAGSGHVTNPIAIGEISLDSAVYRVTKSGKRLHLTPKEFEILEYLMRHADMTIRHDVLLRAVWGPEYGGELEYLRTFVHQLRGKIEDDPARPQYLITEAFVGYRFGNPDDPALSGEKS
ncbi:MAG: response regulator transcription factor [Acidobacteriota bacterium]